MNIKQLLKKHRELIAYLFWGVATTAVNYIVYFVCTKGLQVNYLLSNLISWAAAVIFAFYVNKHFVFASRSWEWKVVLDELWKFVSARIFSGLLETGILYVFVDLLSCNDGAVKIIAGIVVVLLNYVVSKLMIFRTK